MLFMLLDDELSSLEQVQIEGHIVECVGCQRLLETYASGSVFNREPEDRVEDTLDAIETALSSVRDLEPCSAASWSSATPRLDDSQDRRIDLDHLCYEVEIMPRRSGQFRFNGYAGQGGMSVVFRGTDEGSGTMVAIKVLRSRYREHAAMREQFRREASIQASLDHPGISKVIASGEFPDGRPYMVMDYRDGQPLSRLLKFAIEEQRYQHLFAFHQAVEIVAFAHQNGVLHRDLKPANILANGSDVVVLDWGLSERLADMDQTGRLPKPVLDLCRNVVGTPGYIAPEQLQGQKSTPRSDVFSLGVTLAEIVTRKRMGGGGYKRITPVRLAEFSDQINRRVAQCNEPEEVRRIIRRCTSVRPKARPGDAAAVLECLNKIEAFQIARELTHQPASPQHGLSPFLPQSVPTVVGSAPKETQDQGTLSGRCKNGGQRSFYGCNP
ncbi:serine/threonine-protein kinase [Roseiconus lacunae]|uniref:serine/threonine-protein kinase n=1 Tax=Roseiconus lacunae TaxID=2605694 RepID=UPI001E4893BF|nr:serine/threonine-protein kinase [Roseiconus lacunae]MCD0457882.1 serine/threonine protein kinase [Roseiconus lacunae]